MKEDNVLSLTADAAGAAVAGMPMSGLTQPEVTSEIILAAVLKSLDDNKAEEVVQIDLRGKTSVCDHMVICSGRSSRQVAAIAQKLAEDLKHELGVLCKTEGEETGDWVLIDAGDVIVHVFRPEVREFYQLEKMWMPLGKVAQSAT
ncbi:ribosome silencing factor [Yangia mangrovi]|uniref:Ribosomal silencing factor RsfS n=2 Tax=Alloyangia mangrovi TaxID=1779329 RepID=A0ABT2KNS7_9RHOB|nr:ribosome silencing factor [Alloyangia mangrovi]